MKIGSLRYGLAVVTALVFTAIFTMNFFHEGTSISKYLAKQSELDRIKEAEVIAYTDMMLYGDERITVSGDVDLTEEFSSEEGFEKAQRIRSYDRWFLVGLTTVAWLMLIPALQSMRALSFVYVAMGAYIILLSLCKMLNGGAAFSDWAITAHATRWLPCFALWLWLFMKPCAKEQSYRVVKWMLVIAVSLTFTTHGIEALLFHPGFRDLLIGSFEIISIHLSDSLCHLLLRLIGVMDVTLAVLVLFTQRKSLFLWMAIWGGVTALARPITFGEILWEDALLRCGNCLIPLILFLWIWQQTKTKKKNAIEYEDTE